MASQLDYFVARARQDELAWRAEQARLIRDETHLDGAPRGRRLRALVTRLRRRGGLEQRKLPLPPGGAEPARLPAGCLEVD